jgi:hypothetical protein
MVTPGLEVVSGISLVRLLQICFQRRYWANLKGLCVKR